MLKKESIKNVETLTIVKEEKHTVTKRRNKNIREKQLSSNNTLCHRIMNLTSIHIRSNMDWSSHVSLVHSSSTCSHVTCSLAVGTFGNEPVLMASNIKKLLVDDSSVQFELQWDKYLSDISD